MPIKLIIILLRTIAVVAISNLMVMGMMPVLSFIAVLLILIFSLIAFVTGLMISIGIRRDITEKHIWGLVMLLSGMINLIFWFVQLQQIQGAI